MATTPTFNGLAGGSAGKYLKDDFTWDTPSGSSLSDATPLVESGAGSAGTGVAASRSDHVHPAAAQAMTDAGAYVKPTTDGDTIRAYDSGGTEYAEMQHDVLRLRERTADTTPVANMMDWYVKTTAVVNSYTYTKLLLHMNGDDGSTTFTDELGNTMTANNSAQVDTAQKVFGTGSALFDGTGDCITTTTSPNWAFGTENFTVDCRVRFNTIDTVNGYDQIWSSYKDDNNYYEFAYDGRAGVQHINLYFVRGGTVSLVTWNVALSTATWYYFEIVRDGSSGWSNFKLFINGNLQTQHSTSGSGTYDVTDVGQNWGIGGNTNYADGCMDGWIDEFRISKGVARNSSNYTAETSEYTYDVLASTTYDLTWMSPSGNSHVIHTETV